MNFRFRLHLVLPTILMTVLALATSHLYAQQNDDRDAGDSDRALSILAMTERSLAELKLKLEQSVTRLGDSHPSNELMKREIEELNNRIRKLRTVAGKFNKSELYREVQAKYKELGRIVKQMEPLTEEERGIQQSMEILQRTLNELKAKQALNQGLPSVDDRWWATRAQKDQLVTKEKQLAYEEAIAMYQEILAKRSEEMKDMQNAIIVAEAERARLNSERIAAITEAQKRLAKGQYAEALKAQKQAMQQQSELGKKQMAVKKAQNVSVEFNLNERLNRVEKELSEIKRVLKQIAGKLSNDR